MFGAYITAGVTVLTLIMVYGVAFRRREYLYRLQEIGMTTVGAVIDKKISEDSDGHETCTLVIGYTIYDGIDRSHTTSRSIGKGIGEEVLVTYDPAYPQKPEIGLIHPEKVLLIATIFAVIIIIVGVVVALFMLGIIPSNGGDDGSDSAALLLPLPIIMTVFTRMKRLIGRA